MFKKVVAEKVSKTKRGKYTSVLHKMILLSHRVSQKVEDNRKQDVFSVGNYSDLGTRLVLAVVHCSYVRHMYLRPFTLTFGYLFVWLRLDSLTS